MSDSDLVIVSSSHTVGYYAGVEVRRAWSIPSKFDEGPQNVQTNDSGKCWHSINTQCIKNIRKTISGPVKNLRALCYFITMGPTLYFNSLPNVFNCLRFTFPSFVLCKYVNLLVNMLMIVSMLVNGHKLKSATYSYYSYWLTTGKSGKVHPSVSLP